MMIEKFECTKSSFKSELKVKLVSKNSLTRKLNSMAGGCQAAKILHFKDTSAPILLVVGRFIKLTLRLRWGILLLLFTCFKGFVVT